MKKARETSRIEATVNGIIDQIRDKESLLVAFSGGIDSSVVVALAHKALGDKMVAVTVNSPLLPPGSLERARKIAKRIGVKHLVVNLNELELPEFRQNTRNRCYICKKFRFNKLRLLAKDLGIKTIADGTNLSDLEQYRPGLKVLREMNIYSPLLENGLRKNDVYKIAKLFNIPTDVASESCLATRIPYGTEITLNRLKRIAKAESYIRVVIHPRILRVRDHGDIARIEISHEDFSKLLKEEVRAKVISKLKSLGFKFICLDLEGYRFGSFDTLLINQQK